jgi:signal transduction histidine kinase
MLEENVRQRTLQIESQKKEMFEINEELRALNASKDKFFSIIAHDLRNPFNAIIGLTDILLGNISNTDADKLQRTLTNIKNSSAQAHELLENLLTWARNQTGGLQFNPQQINVKQMVEENIALAESQAARKNIQLSATIEHTCMLIGDENMINSVIRNLLTNAIKFTPQNGKVSVVLAEENGSCALSVSDTGIGIAPDRLDTLFSIETKHKTKGTDQEPGTGLGLILCKEFVGKHGGRIEVTSKTGEGSIFRVLLPVKGEGLECLDG